jgi:hypothetical protein
MLGQVGGWIVGPALGYRPFSFHLAGSMVGCSTPPTPCEALVWASYNFMIFAAVPYLYFRRTYSSRDLSLVSVDKSNDWRVILTVLVIESGVQILAMPGIFKMTLPAFLRSAPLAFILFFFGTVLPTMILIYAIILPRYLRLTRSPALTVILGGLTYALMHLVEGWSSLRISRMSAHGFTACQANISVDVSPRFHGMPVQDDAGGWIVSESPFGVNDWRC